jgi:hypothetical protein
LKQSVVFFGFSVTRYGNPPYPVRLKEMLAEKGITDFDIFHAALGGVELGCVPFITDHLEKLKPDIIIFEIATSFYSMSSKNLEDTKEIIIRILQNSSLFCKQIDFLLLPRNDIPKDCTIESGLNELASSYSFGIINIRNIFDQDWDAHAVDYVHPSPLGIDKICQALATHLQERSTSELEIGIDRPKSRELALKNFASPYKYPLLRLFELTSFSHVGIPLREGETFELWSDHECDLYGIFFIMGPDTSSLEIYIGGKKVAIRTFDEHCYYYRIGYQQFYQKYSVKKGELIKITSSGDRMGITLKKETILKIDGVMNYPISFACINAA